MSLSARLHNKWKRSCRSFLFATRLESVLYRQKPACDRIIMYHNVLPQTRQDLNLRNISQSDFYRSMRYLKRRYTIVPLRELINTASNKKRIAITFDDGLINNLRYALPVLTELKIPATVFVTTSWIHGMNVLWPDELSQLLSRINDEVVFKNKTYRRVFANQFKNVAENRTLESSLLECSQQDIDIFLADLKSLTGMRELNKLDENAWRVMKGEEIRILAESEFIEIGSHAVTHRNLNLLSHEELKSELTDSKTYLERVCNRSIDSIAFPFGFYNEAVLEEAKKSGYHLFVGVFPQTNVKNDAYPLCFRLGLYNDSSVTEQLHLINTSFE